MDGIILFSRDRRLIHLIKNTAEGYGVGQFICLKNIDTAFKLSDTKKRYLIMVDLRIVKGNAAKYLQKLRPHLVTVGLVLIVEKCSQEEILSCLSFRLLDLLLKPIETERLLQIFLRFENQIVLERSVSVLSQREVNAYVNGSLVELESEWKIEKELEGLVSLLHSFFEKEKEQWFLMDDVIKWSGCSKIAGHRCINYLLGIHKLRWMMDENDNILYRYRSLEGI